MMWEPDYHLEAAYEDRFRSDVEEFYEDDFFDEYEEEFWDEDDYRDED